MKISKLREQKGVTLIVLVTIIIILLILAGVSVAMLSGNNGIISNAFKARSDNTVGDDIEQIRASYSAEKMNLMRKANGEDYTVTAEALKGRLIADLHLDDDTNLSIRSVTSEDIEASRNTGDSNDEVIPEGSLRVTMPSKKTYIVDSDGNTKLLSDYMS